jgi:hypothetical protein
MSKDTLVTKWRRGAAERVPPARPRWPCSIAKAPADAPAFKDWLRHISKHTAEAASEGGLLGFGGVQVSEAKKATLAEVSTALGLEAWTRVAGRIARSTSVP